MRRRPVHLICCVLIAAVSACGHSDAAGGDFTTTTVAGSTETTIAGSQIDYGAIALSLAESISSVGEVTVRGWITAADDETVTIKIHDVVDSKLGPEVVLEEGVVLTALPFADRVDPTGAKAGLLAEAVGSRAPDGLPAMVTIVPGNTIIAVFALDESLTSFERDTTLEPAAVYWRAWTLARAIDGGYVVAYLAPTVDPEIPIYCQYPTPREVRFRPESGDEVADLIAFGTEVLEEEAASHSIFPSGASDLAVQTTFKDSVTGLWTVGYATDVEDQFRRGVNVEDLMVHRTVPVLLKPGELTWAEAGPAVVFVEAGTRRLLGWFDFRAYDPAKEAKESILEIMVSPTGADLEIHIRDMSRRTFTCIDGGSEPLMIVPFDQVFGTKRAAIDLDTQAVTDWDGSTSE